VYELEKKLVANERERCEGLRKKKKKKKSAVQGPELTKGGITFPGQTGGFVTREKKGEGAQLGVGIELGGVP